MENKKEKVSMPKPFSTREVVITSLGSFVLTAGIIFASNHFKKQNDPQEVERNLNDPADFRNVSIYNHHKKVNTNVTEEVKSQAKKDLLYVVDYHHGIHHFPFTGARLLNALSVFLCEHPNLEVCAVMEHTTVWKGLDSKAPVTTGYTFVFRNKRP